MFDNGTTNYCLKYKINSDIMYYIVNCNMLIFTNYIYILYIYKLEDLDIYSVFQR